jgi:GntR family transcriptional regulator, transcriptional repressor for pyruvate dehydrogenase complex
MERTKDVKNIEPISKDLLHQKVSDSILSYIFRNGLKPGDKLPSERVLSAELAVGRNSVRQGLSQLEEKGIIERQAAKGAFVKKEVSMDSMELKLMQVDYMDLLEIKISLEQLAIRRSIKKATEEQIGRLRKLAEKLQEYADRNVFSLELDRQFHSALIECGGSPTLSQLISSLIDNLDSYMNILGDVSEIWIKTIPYHLDIVEALEKRQLEYALAAHQYIYQYDTKVLEDFSEKFQ